MANGAGHHHHPVAVGVEELGCLHTAVPVEPVAALTIQIHGPWLNEFRPLSKCVEVLCLLIGLLYPIYLNDAAAFGTTVRVRYIVLLRACQDPRYDTRSIIL